MAKCGGNTCNRKCHRSLRTSHPGTLWNRPLRQGLFRHSLAFVAIREPVSNYLKIEKREQDRSLIALSWSDRRIASEMGVHRETVGKLRGALVAEPAEVFAGFVSRSMTAAFRIEIDVKLQAGLTSQRI